MAIWYFSTSTVGKELEDVFKNLIIFFNLSGVDGLRVVDASIFPQIPSGNLNAPTIMTAERMSDLIKNKTPLPPANVPVYQPSQLETRR